MARRSALAVLRDIDKFVPTDGNWLRLDELLAELWSEGVTPGQLSVLFRVFERFPHEDGAGVLWSIVHGVESLPLDYESVLRESLARQPSLMAEVMLGRLENAKRRS